MGAPCRNPEHTKRNARGVCMKCASIRYMRWRAKPGNREKANAWVRAWDHRQPRVGFNSGRFVKCSKPGHTEKLNNGSCRNCQRAFAKERQAAKKTSTPAWVDKEFLRIIYDCCPPGHHVDHIVPLKGKTVCGLHVAHNLQYLPAQENIRKGNRLWEEYLCI